MLTYPLLFALIPAALAQYQPQQCDGQAIPEAQALAPHFPPLIPGQIATILADDQEARDLFNAILATNSEFLNITPALSVDGIPQVGTYDWHADEACWWSFTQCRTPRTDQIPADTYSCQSQNTWGLSVDDGPTCSSSQLYDVLEEYNTLASLYYIGLNVLWHPREAQRGYRAGHEICAHTWSHSALTTLTNEQLFAELYYSKKVIKDVVGVSTRCMRPPMGDVDNRVRFMAMQLDMAVHMWNQNTDDFSFRRIGEDVVDQNYNTIINQNAQPSAEGIVVLTHESNPGVIQLFVDHFPRIHSQFAHVAPVSVCNERSRVYGEHDAATFPGIWQYASGERPNVWETPSIQDRDLRLFWRGSKQPVRASYIQLLLFGVFFQLFFYFFMVSRINNRTMATYPIGLPRGASDLC